MSIEELKLLQSNIIKKNKKCNIIGFTIIGIIIGLTLIIILPFKDEYMFSSIVIFAELFGLTVIFFIIKHGINSKDIEKFSKEYKSIFVLKSLKQVFKDLDYKPDEGFSEDYIRQVGMLYTGDSFSSNDFISGTYNNIKFKQSDIHIQEVHQEEDSDGNVRDVWVTIFLGRLMIFDFNKEFKANIQIVSRDFGASGTPFKKTFSEVEMEDVEFNKHFSVYAEDEHEAFYILTPNFMEKIKAITEKINCGIMLGFVDSKLHIAVDTSSDSFEYDVFVPIDEQEIEKGISSDIKTITDFVEDLNLDNNLFTKENKK